MTAGTVAYSTRAATDPVAVKLRESALDVLGPLSLRAGTDVKWPTAMKTPEVQIPSEARVPAALGTVVLDVLLGRDGKVRQISKHSKQSPIDEAVISAVKGREYLPTLQNGIYVSVIVPISFRWSGDEVPNQVLAGIKGRCHFLDPDYFQPERKDRPRAVLDPGRSILSGNISNGSRWTIGRVRHTFRAPEDRAEPTMWERECDTDAVLSPGAEVKFECSVDPVDLSRGFRWTFRAWGLPPT